MLGRWLKVDDEESLDQVSKPYRYARKTLGVDVEMNRVNGFKTL